MGKITIHVEIKWVLLFGGVLSLMLLLGARPPASLPNAPTNDVGRYQAVSSERGTIILDTQTGDFVMENIALGKPTWLKGDFKNTFEAGKSFRK